MIRHHFRAALRSLRRHAGYSTINVLGLTVGLACCLLILVFIADEMSYDRHHENADRIARLALETRGGDDVWRGRAQTFYLLADMIGGGLSGVEKTVRIAQDDALLTVGGEPYSRERIMLAEPSYFDVFTTRFVQGNAATAFNGPNTAVLTEAAAARYFGSDDPVGQVLTIDNRQDFEVTAVVEALPKNSHYHFDALLNLESTKERYGPEMFESMGAQWLYTYLLMAAPETAESLSGRVNALAAQYIPPDTPVEVRLAAQPLTDIHLTSHFDAELEPNGDIRYLYVFGVVAIFILVIACVNFMNLATARSSMRAKEVGVRKLLGGSRAMLIRQFLSESVGMALFSALAALGLALAVLPLFNTLAGKEISAAAFMRADALASLFGLALLVGFAAGSYPALFLSSFRPARVLKGLRDAGRRGWAFRMRQGLVVVQFGISVAIVLGTFLVYGQLRYMQNTYPGFDRDQVVSVKLPAGADAALTDRLKSEFSRLPGITSASAASHAPPEKLSSWRTRLAGASEDTNELISWIAVDHDYARTLGLKMAAGRFFDEDHAGEAKTSIVINEAMARFYGIADPVGQKFQFNTSHFPEEGATVVGVVKDYHQTTMHELIRPQFFYLDDYARQILLRLEPGRTREALASLESVWTSVAPETPIEYAFLDDEFAALLGAERRIGHVFEIAALLAIFVACMGLFGLAAYMTERRIREVGVRKVFGASAAQVVSLLTREFVALVAIAFVLAAPLTWMRMQPWLEDFAYRAAFGAWPFVWTATLALAVAILTVSAQAIRAARMNPVETLRYE